MLNKTKNLKILWQNVFIVTTEIFKYELHFLFKIYGVTAALISARHSSFFLKIYRCKCYMYIYDYVHILILIYTNIVYVYLELS